MRWSWFQISLARSETERVIEHLKRLGDKIEGMKRGERRLQKTVRYLPCYHYCDSSHPVSNRVYFLLPHREPPAEQLCALSLFQPQRIISRAERLHVYPLNKQYMNVCVQHVCQHIPHFPRTRKWSWKYFHNLLYNDVGYTLPNVLRIRLHKSLERVGLKSAFCIRPIVGM
jgi:hypothetical protein